MVVTGLMSPYPMVVKLTSENQNASGILINRFLFGLSVVSFSAKNISEPNTVDDIIRKNSNKFKIEPLFLILSIITLRPG